MTHIVTDPKVNISLTLAKYLNKTAEFDRILSNYFKDIVISDGDKLSIKLHNSQWSIDVTSVDIT